MCHVDWEGNGRDSSLGYYGVYHCLDHGGFIDGHYDPLVGNMPMCPEETEKGLTDGQTQGKTQPDQEQQTQMVGSLAIISSFLLHFIGFHAVK